ncbi:hypothetical protein RchiOBHm_Chr2g0104691 [Rosa chinensis]|uniref:Uncharacterized protein n=1 Tax=Rosa chinensis TaxID=74649 RepID=A0A2P6RNA6_ROSCH|nr:hypothetical protein RchiOBHm_Chr2g0104691 [Rosa chinensis]
MLWWKGRPPENLMPAAATTWQYGWASVLVTRILAWASGPGLNSSKHSKMSKKTDLLPRLLAAIF